MQKRAKVFIVDDHSVVIEGIRNLLERSDEFEYVGSESDSSQALASLQSSEADIVILDISMPGKDGMAVAREIKAWSQEIRILVYSMTASQEDVLALFREGISGYVLKHEPMAELRLALRSLKEGAAFYSSEVREILQEHIMKLESEPYQQQSQNKKGIELLSHRENEVFLLLADGMGIKKIADKLCISPKTVESHKYNILEKMGTDSIANLTKLAVKKGLIKID